MSRSVTSAKPRSAYSRSAALRIAARVWSVGIVVMAPMQQGSCNSNACMKLWFEGCDVNRRSAMALARGRRWADSAAKQFWKTGRGASHGLHDVGTADRMAQPRAGLHEQARSPGGADLQAAGGRGCALEGDSDPRGSEEEGQGRGPLEHVHAAERA